MAGLIWIDDVRAKPIPEIMCVVAPGLVPSKGTFVAFGPPGVGKTWMFQELGLDVDTGRDFMSFFRTEPRAVVYYDVEMGPSASTSRLSKVQKSYPDSHRFAILDSNIKLDTVGGREFMRKYVKESQDKTGTAVLVLVDSIARAGELGMVDEETIRRVIGNCKTIAEDESTTFGFVGHSRKMIQFDFKGRRIIRDITLEDLRSTMALAFDVDTSIGVVQCATDTDAIEIAVVKARHCPFPYQDMRYKAKFDRKKGTFQIIIPKYNDLGYKVIDYLKRKGPQGGRKICQDLHENARDVKAVLDELSSVWKCELQDNGEYKLNY